MAKKKHAQHENLERWLVSYADFITLLFAFFVVLFAMSSVDSKKYKETVQSLNTAFGFIMTEGSGQILDVPDAQFIIPPPIKEFTEKTKEEKPPIQTFGELKNEMAKQLEKVMNKADLQDKIKLKVTDRGLEISIDSQLFFNSAEASVLPAIYPILDKLSSVLQQVGNPIIVEGHTDNIPIKTQNYPSNWELSSARAASLIRYFIENHKLKPERLQAAGFAEFKPVTSNSTPEGRAKNRRVEIIVQNTSNKIKVF